ncbi:MAG: hypothetical protein ACI35S_01985 [Anaeroplasma sp.]
MDLKIKKVISKRLNKEEDQYAVVGIELKNRRIALSRTLDGISYNTCSISYLSKIENNKIVPNQSYVRELCKKVELSTDKIDALLELKQTLKVAVIAFFNNDIERIIEISKDIDGLNNYRKKMINLIYHIMNKDMYNANKLMIEIIPLAASMVDYDLIIFCLFSGIIHYYDYCFDEALEDLEVLYNFDSFLEVKLLRDLYIFLCNYALNNSDTILYFERISDELYQNGNYKLLDYSNYIIGIYLIKNKCTFGIDSFIKRINNDKYRNSLLFLHDFFIKKKRKLEKYGKIELSDYCRCLLFLGNNEGYNILEKYDSTFYNPEFDYEIAKYLSLEEEYKNEYILNIVIPKLLKSNEGYMRDFFIKELANNCQSGGKYKFFVQICLKFIRDSEKRLKYEEEI